MSNPVTITAPVGLPFIEIVREFEAPVDAVYRAHEDPALVQQWLGPKGYEMEIEQFELRTGGRYRYLHRNGDATHAFNGVVHVARPNDVIIQTFEWEGQPDVVSIESQTFEDLGDGRTRLTGRSVYPSVEARDSMVDSGMEHGVVDGYERLDDLLAAEPR